MLHFYHFMPTQFLIENCACIMNICNFVEKQIRSIWHAKEPSKANCVTLFMKCYIFIIFWAPFHPNLQVIDNISQYKAELTFNRKKFLIENLNLCMILTHYIFVTVVSCQTPQKLSMTNSFYLLQIVVYIIENLEKISSRNH